ncbi:MAG: hypothetical protein GY832_16575 [Chloroflexi bacterium]|nr:hypothetical protein [Chloroflexota bacterium]
MSNKAAKVLRTASIILMGLTGVITLLGGVGTVCAAWSPERFTSMAPLIPYKWLYQILVILTVAAAVVSFRVTYALLRGERWSHTGALVILLVSLVLAAIQMIASQMLRGKTAPTNYRFYATVITWLVFLLLRIPRVRDRVNFSGSAGDSGSPSATAGLALLLGGVLTLTTSAWAGPTHTVDGSNWVNVLQIPLAVGGGAMVLVGVIVLVVVGLTKFATAQQAAEHTRRSLCSG